MKRNFQLTALVLLLMVITPNLVSAQFRSFVLGIKAAPTISWLSTNQQHYSSEGVTMGFTWGVASEFYFAKNYALATGLNMVFLNGKLSYPDVIDDTDVTLNRKYRMRYLEIPAVLKMKTNDIGSFRYFGQVGLGLGIRTSSKASDEYTLDNKTIVKDFYNIDEQTKLFKASMIVGVGVEYPFDNNTALVASINLNNGFSNILKGKNKVHPALSHEAKPDYIEISVGVMF
ncbi:MAG: porin family protein [Lentimicrobiaceae bacterium]